MQAVFNGKIIAESNETIEVEGNQYFPAESIKKEFFKDSNTTSNCPWKEKRPIILLKLMAKKAPMPPGFTKNRFRPLPK